MKSNQGGGTTVCLALITLLSASLASTLQGCGGQGSKGGNRVTLILAATRDAA